MELQPGKNEARIVELDGKLAVEIMLTQGKTALCDLSDWPSLARHRWQPLKSRRTWYAYRHSHIGGRRTTIYLHRQIMNAPPDEQVDHRDGNGLDCRRHNLRAGTSQQNNRNRGKRAGCSSRFKGVSWHKRNAKWRADINDGVRARTIGYFHDEADAAKAYDREAVIAFGPHARLNFPNAA